MTPPTISSASPGLPVQPQPPTVSASGLTLRYRSARALHHVSFTLGEGVTGLLGPNGAGKTTLLRILATATMADRGAFTVLGHDPRTVAGRQEVRRRLGYLPQDPGFHQGFTAFEFVDYVAILKEMTDRTRRHREVRRALDSVGLADHRGKKIKSLSGGMRQRVGLAAALIGQPPFVVLDEPTAGLDPEQRMRFRELIAEAGDGRTVLLSTHQTEDVAMLCRRVLVLAKGELRFDGTPAELAAVAVGRVWESTSREPGALAGWRTGSGAFRNVGHPPEGARLLDPTLEDGYLLVLDETAGVAV